MNKRLNIGVFGFGCVGQGLYDVLQKTRGMKADITKICVKNRNKNRPISMANFTYNKNDILNNPDIDLVVELIDDADEAYHIVKQAIMNGKSVVTANKKMIAEHFEELFILQKQHNVSFLYEASCCASIPIIRNLEEYYDNDLMSAVEGIINGTTNYILSNMIRNNLSYSTALQQAQDCGFAESNPYLDVEAFDAKFKISIIAAHAFGVFVNPKEIFNYGISKISLHDIRYAKEKNFDIKLIAHCRRNEEILGVWVMPQFIHNDHKLSHVTNEYNGVLVEGAFSDKQFFMGKGAGAYPTGSAVLSDISAVTYNYKYEYKKFSQGERPEYSLHHEIDIYCRYHVASDLERIPLHTIHEQYSSREYNYIIGSTTIAALKNSTIEQLENIFIALMPDR
ncbi:MAG: homoserine dehydrogenase [Candidatus Kapaibacterium sp.]|jgi:homoserine dehydrogenase